MSKGKWVPQHLGAEGRRLWSSVIDNYEIDEAETPAAFTILRLAAEAADRCAQARDVVAKEGLTTVARGTVRAHPAVAVEAQSRRAVSQLLGQLGLLDEED